MIEFLILEGNTVAFKAGMGRHALRAILVRDDNLES